MSLAIADRQRLETMLCELDPLQHKHLREAILFRLGCIDDGASPQWSPETLGMHNPRSFKRTGDQGDENDEDDDLLHSSDRTDSVHKEDVTDKSPYLNLNGNLVIPFSGETRYHWWNSGQSIAETLAELEERFKAE